MKHIEVEGGELALKNSFGDMVIIPKKNKKEVEKMIDTKCWECVDSFVDTLPINEDYAEDGSLYSELLTNDKSQDDFVYDAGTLNEVTITEEAPQWLKYRREYVKNNPFNIDEYVENRVNNPVGREKIKIIDTEKWKKELRQEGLETRYNSAMDYVAGELIRNKPQGNLSRAEWLDGMTAKEEEIIKRNPEYRSSLWQDTKRGLISATEITSAQTFGNILNSPDYTTREKQQMIEEYKDHPIMSKLGDAAKILSPLTVPSKMVQSAYKDGYSFTDALKGKKNDAGIVEDIFTDPLNLVGVGLMGKLSKADKVIDGTKVGSKVLGKTDDIVKPIASSVDDVGKSLTQAPKPTWQMEELPGLHLKSTMEGQAISKIVEPKTGLVNVEQALAIIGKESGGADKVALIKQGLGETLPKKMDYNQFRKVVQDQLIPLERQFSTRTSNYGIGRLGYPLPKRSSYEAAIKHNEEVIAHYKKQIAEGSNNSSLRGDLQKAIQRLENSKKELATLPLENQTLILGNKSKFGRGSDAHGNPDETLGHVHFLRDAENPNILTVTQIQSDAFQGTHRIMPKNTSNATALERQQKSLQRMEELQERNKSILNKMKTEGVDEAGLPVQDYQIKQFEDMVKAQEQSNLFKKADVENFTQKQLLDKNHQERYLQELVDYAGKRGDVNKVRVPTSETAAKVQGYTPVDVEDVIRRYKTQPSFLEQINEASDVEKKFLQEILEGKIKGNTYEPAHQTILKKYSEQPKTIKKLFGVEPKIVTDSKGNTWYEFDIPKKFKEGKGEIKAFTVVPAVTGTKIAGDQKKSKSK